MNEFNSSREQTADRTRIDDLPAVGEELSAEQLKLVVGGLYRSGKGPVAAPCAAIAPIRIDRRPGARATEGASPPSSRCW